MNPRPALVVLAVSAHRSLVETQQAEDVGGVGTAAKRGVDDATVSVGLDEVCDGPGQRRLACAGEIARVAPRLAP
eukprot:11624600-Alexandrium_andersonii.AAC.1